MKLADTGGSKPALFADEAKMTERLTSYDTAKAAIRTLGARWWELWMIDIFGKKVQHDGHTWAYWRGELWFVR